MNYCTYFDKNYLSRGLALYDSILSNSKNKFHLYIVAFDKFTFDFFQKNKFRYLTCIYYKDFENKELLNVKAKRTKVEYLWTCTPSIILFFIKKFSLKECIYLDADIFFFNDPNKIFSKKDNFNVLITSHNYSKKYDQTKTSGKYCVQYIVFKNNKESLKVLNWWKNKCIEWCFNRIEGNKFGDQKYLDVWPNKFKNIKISDNLGVGVAPWNIQRFVVKNKTYPVISENDNQFNLYFYHFHDLKFFFQNKIAFIGTYDFNSNVKNFIYAKYIKKILSIEKKYKTILPNSVLNDTKNTRNKLFVLIRLMLKMIKNYKNIILIK